MWSDARRWILPLIAGLYLLLGLAYSTVNPILESPDELLNYENIRFLAEEQRLPVLQPDEFSKAHHPPLYYVVGGLLTGWTGDDRLDEVVARSNPYWGYRTYEPGVDNKSQYLHDPTLESWPYEGAVLGIHLMRWLSLLMGAGVVVTVYQIGRELFPQESLLAWGAAALVAFNPMFLFIQGSVHNDALTNLLAALTVWGVVRYWRRGPSLRRAAFLGIVSGLGILTKITFLFLGPMVALAMVARSWRDRHTKPHWQRQLAQMLLIGGGLVALIAGWWFVRNQLLYGEPTSMELQSSIWQPRENAPDWEAAVGELDFLFDSFWGAMGFGQITMPGWIYALLWGFVLVTTAGLSRWAVRARRSHGRYRAPAALLAVLLLAPLTAFGATFTRMAVSQTAHFGRYLFTTYGVIAPLLVLGLTEWLPMPWRRSAVSALTAVFLLLGIYGLVGVLAPAYGPPPIYANTDDVEVTHPFTVEYPGLATLLGHEVSPASAVPGQSVAVTLYWQVTGTTSKDYLEFVQLVNRAGERISGRDTHPGLGRYPTSRWQPGQVIVDTIPLHIPEDVDQGPTGLRLDIGMFDDEGKRLETAAGHTTTNIGLIRLAAAEPATPIGVPVLYRISDVAELVAIASPPASVSAGDTLSYTLTWRCLQSPDRDYVVFVHLLDEAGQLLVAYDRPPLDGAFPTHLWQPGDTVVDQRQMSLPPDLPPGTYRVVAGWYHLEGLSRLLVSDEAGRPLPSAAIPLFTLNVGAP